MRFLIEIALVVLLITMGWNQPFREHFAAGLPQSEAKEGDPEGSGKVTTPAPPRAPVESVVAVRPAATPISTPATWMWEPKKMDPATKAKR